MSGDRAKSSQQIGVENVAAVERFIDALRKEGLGLPECKGKVSFGAVATACGVDRGALYKNPGCRALLEAAIQDLGLQGISARDAKGQPDDGKDRRIQRLEEENDSLRAEVEGLRKQLRQYQHIQAHLIETGRRVIP